MAEVRIAGEPVPCPLCGKPALKIPMATPEGTVDLISCECVPKEGVPVIADRRLTGFRIPRYVNLNSPEVTERIQSLAALMRARYPDPSGALDRARKLAVETLRLGEEGFSEAERAILLDWLERLAPPSVVPR